MLDPGYSPTHPEEVALFRENQKFMHSEFHKVLHIDIGKNHVREHEHDFNAQEIFKKMMIFYTKSTKTRENETEILSYITSDKLDSWKITSESFILNWQDQTRLYESLIKMIVICLMI